MIQLKSAREIGLMRRAGHILSDVMDRLRSTVKPFGAVALVEAGGVEAFDIEPPELAILASSHSGEDLHVDAACPRRDGRIVGGWGQPESGEVAFRLLEVGGERSECPARQREHAHARRPHRRRQHRSAPADRRCPSPKRRLAQDREAPAHSR